MDSDLAAPPHPHATSRDALGCGPTGCGPTGCGPTGCGPTGCGTAATAGAPVETLIDRFLAEQASMTAVERFAHHHEERAGPALAPTYVDLMPATPPGPGQQYAFEVDLDACTGCKACVTACHSLNGLDEGETWRSVGVLVTDEGPQHVTAACHHCVDPGCLNGCPVDAYDKDPITGIVTHLDDQCIGCSYCTLTCPYEVPTFDRDRGIVRKCDLCSDRLADGEAPACVQGCPTHAISVRLVDVDEVAAAASRAWPIAAPDPSRTVPTTTYRSARDLTSASPGGLHDVRVGHAHPPLAIMLVLTQVAVGTFLVDLVLRARGGPAGASAAGALLGLGTAVLALAASTLHLGRPRYAYRAVIGLRHSWLSREIVAFAAFAGLATAHAGALVLGVDHPLAVRVLPAAVALAGVAGVACSALIYAVTNRRGWRLAALGPRFALTTLAGGLATVLLTATVTAWAAQADAAAAVALLAPAMVVATLATLAWEATALRHRHGPADDELARSARLLLGPLRGQTRWRVALALLGGVLAPALVISSTATPEAGRAGAALAALLGVAFWLGGELIARWQMFTASAPDRMPGGVR